MAGKRRSAADAACRGGGCGVKEWKGVGGKEGRKNHPRRLCKFDYLCAGDPELRFGGSDPHLHIAVLFHASTCVLQHGDTHFQRHVCFISIITKKDFVLGYKYARMG